MQNNLALNETYFSFCCTIPAELVELWNWFCFEKVHLVLKLCKNLHWSLDSRFSTQKNQTAVHKNYLNVSKGK